MFLESALRGVQMGNETVPACDISWDHDDSYHHDTGYQMLPEHFTWHSSTFDLSNVGDVDFIDWLPYWIEQQHNFELTNQDDDWSSIWEALSNEGDIHTPVQIAIAYQPHYEEERIFIVDGWHRVAMYIRAGRKHIPAIVGVPNAVYLPLPQ